MFMKEREGYRRGRNRKTNNKSNIGWIKEALNGNESNNF